MLDSRGPPRGCAPAEQGNKGSGDAALQECLSTAANYKIALTARIPRFSKTVDRRGKPSSRLP